MAEGFPDSGRAAGLGTLVDNQRLFASVAKARSRAKHTWPPIGGFTVGCGLGAAGEAAIGLWSLALPAGLALLAFALGFSVKLDGGKR